MRQRVCSVSTPPRKGPVISLCCCADMSAYFWPSEHWTLVCGERRGYSNGWSPPRHYRVVPIFIRLEIQFCQLAMLTLSIISFSTRTVLYSSNMHCININAQTNLSIRIRSVCNYIDNIYSSNNFCAIIILTFTFLYHLLKIDDIYFEFFNLLKYSIYNNKL